MKVLIIGDADSIWIKEYCDKVLLPNEFDIIISTHHNSRFNTFYAEKSIKILLQEWDETLTSHFKRTKRFIQELRRIKREDFDFLHVQYCSRYNLRLAYFLKKNAIATFWGSDLLRSNKNNRKEISLYLNQCNKIVVLTDKMYKELGEDRHLKKHINKVSVFDFGITNLDSLKIAIEENDCTRWKSYFNIPLDKVVISIGYNKSEGQQHNTVIRELCMLPEKIKRECFLLFHMSYGECSATYYNEFLTLLSESGINYKIITDYLMGRELAYIRLATDLYINAQVTDSLAATLNEFIYAGKVVFNPKWIDYKELDDLGIEYVQYESINDLPKHIIRFIEEKIPEINRSKNKKQIWDNYSWNARVQDWLRLYRNDNCKQYY